ARGLFARAIAQSGARLARGNDDPLQSTRELLRVLEISPDRIEALWDVPAGKILAAQQLIAAPSEGASAGMAPFSPAPDGDTLPLPLDRAIAAGQTAGVPLLI